MSARTYVTGAERRDAIVAFVDEFRQSHGYGPNAREIAAGVGLGGASAALYQVDQLVAAGRLARTPRVSRSIRLVT